MSNKKGFNPSGRNQADEVIEQVAGGIGIFIFSIILKPFALLGAMLRDEFYNVCGALKQSIVIIWKSKKVLKGKVAALVFLLLLSTLGTTIYLLVNNKISFSLVTLGIFISTPLYLFIFAIIHDSWRTKKEYIIKSLIIIIYIILYFVQIKAIGYVNMVTLIFIIAPMIIYFILQVTVMGYIINSNKFKDEFESAGLKSRMYDKTLYPQLIRKEYLGEKKAKRVVYKFATNLVLEDWKVKKDKLEQQFDTKITNIEYNENTRKVIEMTTFSGKLPDEIEWENSFQERDGLIALGQGYAGKVQLDLNKFPHGVIVGITGVGKTTSGQIFIHQLKDKSDIYLVDFKGLLDFMFHDKVVKDTVTNLEQFEELLEKLIEEANKRKKLLSKMKAKNFLKYNKLVPEKHKMNRIVLFMDEIAEVTSLGKESADILKRLCTFARITRALGFNLIFLTQRASRENLPGDIQDNLSWRMTGHLPTAVSSRIVLDSDLAAHLPLKPGYMALRCSSRLEEFQTYYMDVEKHLDEYGYTQEIIDDERQAALNELEGIEKTNVISFSNKKENKKEDSKEKKEKVVEDKADHETELKDDYGLNELE